MSKITESARGEQCTIRLPGICNFDPATTVFAHENGGGMGMKNADHRGAYSCSSCHDVIDGRVMTLYDKQFLELAHLQGILETQDRLIDKGLIVVAGA